MLMRKTILVVDDSDETRLMLLRMLQGEGYSSLEARNGVEALAKVDEYAPDLIIMDLNMPHLDGLTATERIREYREHRFGVPIVAITAFDTYGMKEAAIEAGCNEYLLKPLDLDQLGNVLRQHLGYL
jgi:two-component system, OmpR family, response regulator MprA